MNGERIAQGSSGIARWCKWYLLDAVQGNDDGVWVDTDGFYPLSVQVVGVIAASVPVCGSHALRLPPNTDHGSTITRDILRDTLIPIPMPVSWLKCRVTKHKVGIITVILEGMGGNV